MSLIMGPTGLNNWSYLLELGNIAAFDFGYSLASTNKPISTNLVTIYMSIRSQMSFIMGQVIPDQSVLFALETEKLKIELQYLVFIFFVNLYRLVLR